MSKTDGNSLIKKACQGDETAQERLFEAACHFVVILVLLLVSA